MVVYYHNTEIRLRSRHALIVRMYGKVIEYYPKAGVVLFVLYITHSTVEQTTTYLPVRLPLPRRYKAHSGLDNTMLIDNITNMLLIMQ